MKSKVHFSTYCTIITIAVLALFVVGIVSTRNESPKCLILCIITALATLAGLYYCPISVAADSKSVKIHRLLSGDKTFNYSDIESIDTFYPSPGSIKTVRKRRFLWLLGIFQRHHHRPVFRLLCRPQPEFLHKAEKQEAICTKLRQSYRDGEIHS